MHEVRHYSQHPDTGAKPFKVTSVEEARILFNTPGRLKGEKVFTPTCEVCGESFTTTSGTALKCPGCRAAPHSLKTL